MRPENPTLRIGTRSSALALWQANHVAERIGALPNAPAVELVRIKTVGDRVLDSPLSAVEGKAFFTKEIEAALLEERVDLAVHSFKDLATVMPVGLAIGAVLEREDPRDVLLSTSGGDLGGLPPGASVGTSSLRRKALIARQYPDLALVDLRGNVPTRIQKLDDGEYDAIVLAAAGVKRLGMADRISAYLSPVEMPPAVAQGAVAVQVREGDEESGRWVGSLDHAPTRAATAAERALLRELEGGCQIPVGALATTGNGELSLSAIVCSLDGSESIEGSRRGTIGDAEAIGQQLAGELLERGADRILREIRGAGGEAP